MTVERIHRVIKRTAEEKDRLQAIRDRFQTERPSLAQLVSEDGYNEPVPHGAYLGLQQAVAELRKAREQAGLSLAHVAERSGIDKAALSRLETGRQLNPTVATLARYAKAVGKQLGWTIEEAPPSPDFVAKANPGGSPGTSEQQRAAPSSKRQPARRSLTVEAVTKAYVEVRGSDLHSTDRVIADPELDARFLERCRQLGVSGSDFDLNWCLFNARKGKHLGDVPKAKRFTISRSESDQFLFASEIALGIIVDQRTEAGRDTSLDRVICDPELAKEFDKIARRLAPGFSPLYYRWGALSLRKAAGRIRNEAEAAECPKFETLGSISNVKLGDLPAIQGLYLIESSDRPLYVGETLNIRGRIERHLQYGEGKVLPDWLLPDYKVADLTLGLYPMPEYEMHAIDVCELKAKITLNPRLNVVG